MSVIKDKRQYVEAQYVIKGSKISEFEAKISNLQWSLPISPGRLFSARTSNAQEHIALTGVCKCNNSQTFGHNGTKLNRLNGRSSCPPLTTKVLDLTRTQHQTTRPGFKRERQSPTRPFSSRPLKWVSQKRTIKSWSFFAVRRKGVWCPRWIGGIAVLRERAGYCHVHKWIMKRFLHGAKSIMERWGQRISTGWFFFSFFPSLVICPSV